MRDRDQAFRKDLRERAVRHFFGPPYRLLKLWVEGGIAEDDSRIESNVREMYRLLIVAYELGYSEGRSHAGGE